MSSEQDLPPMPAPFKSLDEAFRHVTGKDVRIQDRRPLAGGDINTAWKVTLSDGSLLFLKENSVNNLSFFSSEYRALLEMRRVGQIGIPEPMAFGVDGKKAFLILPYLDSGGRKPDYWRVFGRSLARFHLSGKGDRFGFYEDNFIGASPQSNSWNDNWIDFFREERLEFQVRMAASHIDGGMSRRFLRFMDRLENFLPPPAAPLLLHGDLWSGNIYSGPDGYAWIIDPAAYYGHPEADLAMTELFGSLPGEFYRSYEEVNPLEPEYDERRGIYNLYHLLNHLNMFGSSYLGSVKSIIERFS